MSQCHLTCSGVKRLPQKCPVVSWWCGLEYMVDSGHLISQIFRGRPGRDGFYTPQTSWILEPLMTGPITTSDSMGLQTVLPPTQCWGHTPCGIKGMVRGSGWKRRLLPNEYAEQASKRTPSMFDGFIFSRAVGDWVQKYVFLILKKLVLALPFQFLSRCPWSLVG